MRCLSLLENIEPHGTTATPKACDLSSLSKMKYYADLHGTDTRTVDHVIFPLSLMCSVHSFKRILD